MSESKGDTRSRVAALLKQYRERAGLTVVEVGSKIGKSDKTVSAWENGRGQPDAEMFLKLCDVYNVESVSVFFGQDRPRKGESLTDDEREILELWREATAAGRESAAMVLRCNKLPIKKESAM